MSGLPRRFPRASLIQQAAMLESRVNKLMDETEQQRKFAQDRGLDLITPKLEARLHQLDNARFAINTARLALWDLP